MRIPGALAVTFLLAGPAFASEAGAEHHAPSVALLGLNFINFAIYAFILYRFAWPPIRRYLKDRRTGVVAALEAARRARADAEALRAEYEGKMRTLEADAARERAKIVELAELEAKSLLEQARQSAERIRRDARLVADQEVERARRILQEESAELVARLAGDLIARQITPQDQARFIADFVRQTGDTVANGAGSAR